MFVQDNARRETINAFAQTITNCEIVDVNLNMQWRSVLYSGFGYIYRPVLDDKGNPILGEDGNPLLYVLTVPGNNRASLYACTTYDLPDGARYPRTGQTLDNFGTYIEWQDGGSHTDPIYEYYPAEDYLNTGNIIRNVNPPLPNYQTFVRSTKCRLTRPIIAAFPYFSTSTLGLYGTAGATPTATV